MDSKIHFVVTLTYHAFEAVDHIKFLWQDLCDDAASAGGEWLERQEGDVWRGNWMLPVGEGTMFGFYFEVWRCEEMIDTEPRYCHYATIPSLDGVEMTCRWITNGDENNYRYTSAFTRCIYPLTKVFWMLGCEQGHYYGEGGQLFFQHLSVLFDMFLGI